MPPKVLRKSTRRARLQVPPADPRDVEQTEEMQLHPQHQAPSPAVQPNVRHDEEQKDSELPELPQGDMFRGHKFYLARTLRAERRAEMRLLITQNGGEVVPEMALDAIEIVERAQLKPNENWVAAEFIEDSLQDGELKNVLQYMAPRIEKPRRTPSGRPLKRFFTVDEQAKMLRFLHTEHPKYYNKPTVPESIWKRAVAQELFDRTSSSLHEHYRKQLGPLTRLERDAIFEKAGVKNLDHDSIATETEGGAKAETERLPPLAATPSKTTSIEAEAEAKAEETEGQAEAEAEATDKETDTQQVGDGDDMDSDDEIQGRVKKRLKKTSAMGEEGDVENDNERDAETSVPEELTQTLDDEPTDEHAPRPQTPPPAEPIDHIEAPDEEEAGRNEEEQEEPPKFPPRGVVFQSYWQSLANSPTRIRQLDRFFIPPPPPPITEKATPPTRLLSSATKSSHRSPQRTRRLSHVNAPTPDRSLSTPTPQKRRRSGRFSLDSTRSSPGTRTPARAAQQALLDQLEEVVGQRMTPPSRRKSLDRLIPVAEASADDADALLARLQFETGHDLNTVCSALYWSSGDSDVARAFLKGRLPIEYWCPNDDRLLHEYARDDVTEAELANARHRGAFDTMTTKRSARDILRRIQFLL